MITETQLREAIERYKNRRDGIYKKWSDESKRKLFFTRVREAVEETISVIEQGKFQKEREHNPLHKIADAYIDWGCLTPDINVMHNILRKSNIYSTLDGQKAFADCLRFFLKSSEFEELCDALRNLFRVKDKFQIKGLGNSDISLILYGLHPNKFAPTNNYIWWALEYYYAPKYREQAYEIDNDEFCIFHSNFIMDEKKKFGDLLTSEDLGEFVGLFVEGIKLSVSLRWTETTTYSIGDRVEARNMRYGDDEWCPGKIEKRENELYYIWYDDDDNKEWDKPWRSLDAIDIRPLGVRIEPISTTNGTEPETSKKPIGQDGKTQVSEPSEEEPTQHLKMQWMLVKLGHLRKKLIWVPARDRGKTYSGESLTALTIDELPLHGFKEDEKKIIQEIDVIWLDPDGGRITDLFEIESTTQIFSGLLRMSDLLALQSGLLYDCSVNIVAPKDKEGKATKEMDRPTFKHLKKARTYKYHSFEDISESLDAQQKMTI